VLVNNITERIKLEQQREFERRDKEALINNTRDMMWSVSRELKLMAANRGFMEVARIVLGREFRTGDPALPDTFPAEFRDRWGRIYQKVLNGEPHEEEFFTEGAGYVEKHWLEIRFHPIYDDAGEIKGVACYGRDITERKKNEEALRQSNERYDLVSRATSDMVWDVNLLTGEVYQSREGWEKLFGHFHHEPNSAAEQAWKDRLHPQDRERHAALLHRIATSPDLHYFEFEGRVRRDDGTYAHTLDRGYVIRDSDGRVVRITGATRDITEKKEAEEKLRQAEKQKQLEITGAVISAQEKERQEIGRELHDNINQLLATARLYVAVTKDQEIPDRSIIAKADEILGSAITEIRELSHALIPPSLGKTKLTEAISLILDTMSKTGKFIVHRKFSRITDGLIPEELKLAVYRILQEQLNNIQKYAKAQNVYVELTQRGEKLKLVVRDDGVGFDTSKKAPGIGIRNMRTRASLFNGRIKIISAEGQGCELVATFVS
jgi:PAS domain S-box-containing protein